MTDRLAAYILRIYNLWRRGEGVWEDRTHADLPFTNEELGQAIDHAVGKLKPTRKKSIPASSTWEDTRANCS
jgi:hypothetical protein